MSKPLPSQVTFAGQTPPWQLVQLDGNFSNLWASINDYGTYNLVFTDTGAVNALVVTPAAGLTLALVDGLALDVIVGNTTTSSTPTLNANGTGAKTIVQSDNSALGFYQLLAGMRSRFIYDGTNGVWRVQAGASSSGSFTATLTGVTSGSGTINWLRSGNMVMLFAPNNITGTSNASTMSITGLPTSITPLSTNGSAFTSWPSFCFEDNGALRVLGESSLGGGASTINFGRVTVSGSLAQSGQNNWTASGTKGILQGWTLVYSML